LGAGFGTHSSGNMSLFPYRGRHRQSAGAMAYVEKVGIAKKQAMPQGADIEAAALLRSG